MSHIHDEHPPAQHTFQTWRGIIDSDPASASERVMVIVQDFDEGQHWGPCKWQARGLTLPGRGDSCLLVLDNTGEPWVIAWWPYTT